MSKARIIRAWKDDECRQTLSASEQTLLPTNPAGSSRTGLIVVLTATLLCGLAVSASAQNPAVLEIASEQGFTVPANVETPIVLKTKPDAVCDLHNEEFNDRAHSLRLYANSDGYVRVHTTLKKVAGEDAGRVLLDCTADGKITRYPLHLRGADSPTADMPAPQAEVPVPTGSIVLPALTEEEAQRLSDAELKSLGYPMRPDAAKSPRMYTKWLNRVSRHLTMLPSKQVPTDISYQMQNEKATYGPVQNSHWCGYAYQTGTGASQA